MEWLSKIFASKQNLYQFTPEIQVNYHEIIGKILELLTNQIKHLHHIVILCIGSSTHKLSHVVTKNNNNSTGNIFDVIVRLQRLCKMSQVNVTLYDINDKPLSKYSSIDNEFDRYRIRHISRLFQTLQLHEEIINIYFRDNRCINMKPLEPVKPITTTLKHSTPDNNIPNLILINNVISHVFCKTYYKKYIQELINIVPSVFTNMIIDITVMGNQYYLDLNLADYKTLCEIPRNIESIISDLLLSVSGNSIEIKFHNQFGTIEMIYQKNYDTPVKTIMR